MSLTERYSDKSPAELRKFFLNPPHAKADPWRDLPRNTIRASKAPKIAPTDEPRAATPARPWRDPEMVEKFRQLYEAGIVLKEIQTELQLTGGAVRKLRGMFPDRPHPRPSANKTSEILELLAAGHNYAEIGRMVGLYPTTVRATCRSSPLMAEIQTGRHSRINAIMNECCRYYHVHPDALRGKCRDGRAVHARHVAAYLMHQLKPTPSKARIACILGGRDHTTIIHGLRKIEARLQSDAKLRDEIGDLQKRLAA